MTSLTAYGSSVAATTVTTANKMSSTTGGTETTKTTSVASGSGNGYLEVLSQGGTGTVVGSLPGSPSGKGWLFDVTTLEGQTMASGTWTCALPVADTAGSGPLLQMIMRAWKRSSGGTYTSIGSMTLSAPTILTTRAVFTLTGSSIPAVSFATGDKLYFEAFLQANGWGGDFIVVYESNSGTAGVTNDVMITTSGYAPTIVDQPISPLEVVAVADSVAAQSSQSNNAVERIGVVETVSTPIGLSPIETIRVNDATSTTTTFNQTDRSPIDARVVATNTPNSSSSDPNAQMTNDDAELEYAVLRLAPLTIAIARIFFVRYPPARVLSFHVIPTDLFVLLSGEDYTQIHQLSTINEVNAFITAHS